MKILIAHNDYAKYSGEEAVVDKMASMFTELGHQVVLLRMSTAGDRDSLKGKAKGFVAGLWCPSGVKAMREMLEREQPDIVNVHNLYPYISPAALRECKKRGVPVVMTVHNYRLVCPTGLFMRNNSSCEECLKKGNEWACIKYNCENSALKSLGYAARNALARIRRHYMDCVDRFACLTSFQKQKLIEAGFPEEKLTVIPNSIDLKGGLPHAPEVTDSPSYIAYSGRISHEKGVDIIIETARRNPTLRFKLAGQVRDKELVENLPQNVELMGFLSGDSLEDFYRNASFFVMASRCYEGFPMAIIEAARYGKPVIAPDHGGFTEIISSGDENIGLLFKPGNIDDFEQKVLSLWQDRNLISQLGRKAFEKLQKQYSTEVIAGKWERLLEEVIRQRRGIAAAPQGWCR